MMNEIRDAMDYFDLREQEGHFDHAVVGDPSTVTYFEQAVKMVTDAGFSARLNAETDETLEIRNEYGRHVAMVDSYSSRVTNNGLMPDGLRGAIQDLRLVIPFENEPILEAQRQAALQEQQTAGELITIDNIAVDEDLVIDGNHVNAYIAAWFDVDNRFGAETYDTGDTVNLYADYYPDGNRLDAYYIIQHADGADSDPVPVDLADSEREAILTSMKEAGLDDCVAEMSEEPESGVTMQ